MKKKIKLLVATLSFSTVFLFCQSAPTTYDMKGYIVDTKVNSSGEVTVLVDGRSIETEQMLISDYGWAHISDNTDIYLNGKKVDSYPFTIDPSVVVYVTYDGLVAESYPVQGAAKTIFIEN